MTAPRMRVRAGWAIALLLIGALGFTASFRGVLAPIVFVLACVVPFGIVRLGRLLRAGAVLPALVSLGLAALGAWLVLRDADVSPGDAVPRLLTTPRPAEAAAALLTPPALLVALVASVVAAVVLAEPDSERFAGLLAPVLGAAALYTAAQLLAAGTADRYGAAAIALLVVTVAGWTYPYARGRAAAWRPLAVVPLLLAVALGLGAAALTSTAAAFDPREHVTPPTLQLNEASPLTQLRAWTANPTVPILRAKVSGTTRLQLATLDTYTGAAWQVDSQYRRLGLAGATDLPAGARRQPVRATVQLGRLGGVWLPTPGVASGSSLSDVLVDPDDGTLALPGGVHPGLVYDVMGQLDSPTDQQVSVAAVPVDVPPVYLDLADGPVAFAQYARNAVRGASTPLEEAVALENAVATDRRVDPKAPSGSSFGRLSTFLFGRAGTAGVGVGTAEQFAAAFAVLGREVGLPTRLVVGFQLGRPDASGAVQVRGRDATVWPEVYLAGAGWVAFSPTPGADGTGPDGALRDNVLQRLSERVKNLPPAVVTPSGNATGPVRPGHAAPPVRGARAAQSGALPAWVLAVVIAGGALLLILAILVALRVLRTRRHRRRGARGAWAELEDLLVLIGRAPARDRPAPQIAADAADVLGEPGAAIAAAADREAFAPRPGPSTPVWGHVRVLRRRAVRTVPRYRRPFLRVDPRPLLRR